MRRLLVLAAAAALGCGGRSARPPSGDGLEALFDDHAFDPAGLETEVTDPDPAGRLEAWVRAVLEPADPATVERIRLRTLQRIGELEAELAEERTRSPYGSVGERRSLRRRIAYETERLRRIEGGL